MMKAILVPIDNRPVTYVFPQLIARIAGVQAVVPPRAQMGSLTSWTNPDELSTWLVDTVKNADASAVLACADSIIYGGLIPSRRTNAPASELLERARIFTRLKGKHSAVSAVLVQSSIMRISDNYDNTEEKEYWARYGREIFAWSEALHRLSGTTSGAPATGELQRLESRIDESVRRDYLETRRRNFQVHRRLLDYAQSGDIDFLIYSQDDSGQYGLNVHEKERLIAEAKDRGLTNVVAYAGADEVLMTMLARWLIRSLTGQPRIAVSFSPTGSGNIASRYEGQSIATSVSNQLSAAGLDNRKDDADDCDLHFVVHTSGDRQGDHIWLPGHPDTRNLNTTAAVAHTVRLIESSKVPVVLCDVAYANGADPTLIDALFAKPQLLHKLWGYAGWNTTGNALGSAIATASARWFAHVHKRDAAAEMPLKDALFVRLADDWAYQTQVRKEMSAGSLSEKRLAELMQPYLKRTAQALNHQPGGVHLSLPWQRTFEVEVATSAIMHS